MAAGYPNGFDVTLHDVTKPGPADEVRAQLAQIGIRVTVAAVPEREFFPALRRRELSLWLVGDGAMTGEAGWLLATQFHSPDPGSGLGLNNSAATNDLDRAIEEADAIYDLVRARRALSGPCAWPRTASRGRLFFGRGSLHPRPRSHVEPLERH